MFFLREDHFTLYFSGNFSTLVSEVTDIRQIFFAKYE